MKKIYFSFVLCLFVLGGLKAQEKPNLVKLNLFPLTAGNVALEYERPIANRITINGTVSWRPKTGLPYKSIWGSMIDDEDDILGNAKLGAFSITPEVRFYMGKKDAFKGFYIAPFVKYSNYNLAMNIDLNEGGANEVVPISGSLDAFTAGFAIGSQWNLAKDLYLDWRIIGPNYGFSNGKFEGRTNLSAEEQAEVRDQLRDFDFPLVDLEYDVNANGVNMTAKGPFAGIRTALSIGYRF